MNSIHIENVSKNYTLGKVEVPALKNISLSVKHGEIICLMGPSGSGKSTLLNLIGALDTPTNGEVHINGENISTLTDRALSKFRNRTLGFIFQSFNLIPVLSVSENIEYPLLIQDISALKRRDRVKEYIDAVGLTPYSSRYPDELSGGQRQRVAIARALATHPSIIIADEPTANLDHKTGKEVMDLISSMNKKSGSTVIFATHDPIVSNYTKKIIRLKDGEISEI
ncbi:MAG TPA: ABC transporter ATP-binding protein [Spirochaetota bacterium]|nr:ABC transporter ATP-binding protein [Spirochaetota bacterium]